LHQSPWHRQRKRLLWRWWSWREKIQARSKLRVWQIILVLAVIAVSYKVIVKLATYTLAPPE
jgi:hypothetical protein